MVQVFLLGESASQPLFIQQAGLVIIENHLLPPAKASHADGAKARMPLEPGGERPNEAGPVLTEGRIKIVGKGSDPIGPWDGLKRRKPARSPACQNLDPPDKILPPEKCLPSADQ